MVFVFGFVFNCVDGRNGFWLNFELGVCVCFVFGCVCCCVCFGVALVGVKMGRS